MTRTDSRIKLTGRFVVSKGKMGVSQRCVTWITYGDNVNVAVVIIANNTEKLRRVRANSIKRRRLPVV